MMRPVQSGFRQEEGGFFTIWILGLCMCLFFIGGVSFDLWHAYDQRRELAGMVDGAAIAGASQISLAAFKGTPSVVKLDDAAATNRALLYIANEQSQTPLPLTGRTAQVNATSTQIVVTATATVQLNFIGNFLPSAQPLNISVQGEASPQVAP